jgi:hypothetical protein
MRGRVLRAGGAGALVLAIALATVGCFDAPKIEDRWTRVDLLGSNLAPGAALPAGSADSITASVDVIYRRIVTGYAVAELRSSSVPVTSVALAPNAPRVPMAQNIDLILQNSVTQGRAVRAVTGWDHLIQHIDFSFVGTVPATVDSASAGLFLLCYLGSGVKIERPGQADTVIVTPYTSQPYQILPVGLELAVQ